MTLYTYFFAIPLRVFRVLNIAYPLLFRVCYTLFPAGPSRTCANVGLIVGNLVSV